MGYSVPNIGILVTILAFALWYIGESIRIARFKKHHGCQPVCKIPQSERVVGFGLYRTQINASKDGTILELAQGRYDTYGLTWQASMMGQVYTNTIDIENIKTILASNFKDFGLGQREEAFGPMLGQGIFTTDGAKWEHSRASIGLTDTYRLAANLDTGSRQTKFHQSSGS